MNWKTALSTAGKLFVVVVTLAGCQTLQPANVESLTRVVGEDLPGAQGKTETDQRKIDSAVAGMCGADLYKRELCDKHTVASAERYMQF